MKLRKMKIISICMTFVFLVSTFFLNSRLIFAVATPNQNSNEEIQEEQLEEEEEIKEENEKENEEEMEQENEENKSTIEEHFEHSNIEEYMQSPAVKVQKALCRYDLFDEYFENLKVNVTNVCINSTQHYSNLINGKEKIKLPEKYSGVNITEMIRYPQEYLKAVEPLSEKILITKSTPRRDKKYEERANTYSDVIPAFSSMIYPGQILRYSDEMIRGRVDEIELEEVRAGGNFTIDEVLGSKIKYKKGKGAEFDVDKVNKDDVYNGIISSIDSKAELRKDIRTSQLTSPEQVAFELGCSVDAVENIAGRFMEKVRTGEKQVALALVRTPVATVNYAIDYPSNLFDENRLDSNDISRIKSKINETNQGLVVDQVEYGMAQLVLAEVNTDKTYNTQAENGFVDTADLEGALEKHCMGIMDKDENKKTRQKNSLDNARFYYMTFGGERGVSGVYSDTLSNIDKKIPYKFASKKQRLIPLSYRASFLGSINGHIKFKTNAPKYDFCCVEGKKTGAFVVEESTTGNGSDLQEKRVYGIDLEHFNETNEIIEKRYVNISRKDSGHERARDATRYPAYQCVFGLEADARPKRNATHSFSRDRIVNGAFYSANVYSSKYPDDNSQTREKHTLTGPVDIGRPITVKCVYWSEDAGFNFNGVDYHANNKGVVDVKREWEKNLKGNGLRYVN